MSAGAGQWFCASSEVEGRAEWKGRYGFMTEDGTVVIKYKYDEATPFKDGIAK